LEFTVASTLEPAMALTRAELVASNDQVTDSDYEAILSVIMETARGRSFLIEYARRNRRADVEMILTKIDKLNGGHNDDLFDFRALLSE
jgi:hypothetical protein